MINYFSLTRSRMWRTRAATALAAAGALVMSGGLVMLSAPLATAGNHNGDGEHKTSICHRTASDSNPYVFITVDDSSLDAHYNNLPGHPAKQWKTDGTFKGVAHLAGDPKNDYAATSSADCEDDTVTPADECPDLPGLQDDDFPCTKAATERRVPQSEESCTLEGVGGERTWTDVYTTTYTFDETEQDWVANAETGPVEEDSVFTPYTAEERLDHECDEILGVQEISPRVTFADPTCARPNRTTWSGNLRDIVNYTVSRAPARGRTITVTASIKPALADEFGFPDGFDNTSTHTYPTLADLNCVRGEETTRPKPDDEPTVLGTQASAPTAVSAGLSEMPGTDSSTSSLLAQLMVGGGLLLLLAGGWLGFGRREYGDHQA